MKNVAVLASGKGTALLIALLLTPVISRLFSPADFGVVALLIAISTVIGDISTLNYQFAIVLPKDNEKASSVVALSKALVCFFVLFLLIFLASFSLLGWTMPFEDTLGNWLWATPTLVGIIGFGQIRAGALTRIKAFGVISRSDIAQALTTTGSRIILGFLFGSSVAGLAFGYMFGWIAKLWILKSSTKDYLQLNAANAMKNSLSAARDYKDFPIFGVPSVLLSSISAKLPILMLGLWLGPAAVGFYAMADRVIRGPVDAFSIALRRVFLQSAAEMEAGGRSIARFFNKITLVLLVTGIVPFGLLGLFGEQTITILLGESWRDAGHFAQILAPWFYALWVSGIVAPIMTVKRKQAVWLRLQFIVFISRAAVLGGCYFSEQSAGFTLHSFVLVNVALASMMMIAGFIVSSAASGSRTVLNT